MEVLNDHPEKARSQKQFSVSLLLPCRLFCMEAAGFVWAKVVEVFDPPLYDKSKERVAQSHYFVKDFKPLRLGTLHLEKGRGRLRLGALDIKGSRVIDVHALELNRR